MSRSPRRNVPTTSTFTRTQRVLIITLGVGLALSGVVLSKSATLREKLGLSAGSKPAELQQPSKSAAAGNEGNFLRRISANRTVGQFSLLSPLAPTVSATKTDALFSDVDNDTQADPGDVLKYTVTINASGQDATGVTFTDTVDPNTTFVPGSLRATPVAVDDTYSATGNIRISVPAPGVLGNDFAGVPSATITGAPVTTTSTNGGNVTLNANGSFTYNPPAGFEGADTFSYTLTNSAGSNSATVTINVSGMIWFINNTASCPCDGRLTNPFNTLASFAAVNNGVSNNPAANDNIFLYESASDYVGPVILLNGQRFIGQDATASLSAITGLTPPAGSDPLPVTNSGNATIVNITSASTAITVGSGNTLTGFTGGNAGTDISGTGFGTLTISDVTLNGTGQALNLTNGTLAASFGSISSTNSTTTGITLTGVAGTLTTPTTTVTNPTGIGISVGTSSATLNFGTTSSTGSGGTGVSLLANTGAITFGTLTITPDAAQRGLLATDNSLTITSTGGAISTTGAIAVEITRASGTTPLAISQTSISASSSTNGIKLTNVSGSFTVAGNGGASNDGSGGTISGTSAEGILINTASNVSLGYMNISNSGTDGISATGVNGFTLNRSNVTDSAGGAADDGVVIINNSGTVTFSNDTIANSPHNGITVDNNNTNMAGFNLTNTTISCASGQPCQPSGSIGNDGLLIDMRGTSVLTSGLVSASTVSGSRAVAVQVQTNNSGRIGSNSGGVITAPAASNSITIQNNTFTGNGQGIDIDESQISNVSFQILTNTIVGKLTAPSATPSQASGNAINAFTSAGADTGPTSHTFVGKIDGNTIGTQGVNDSGSGFGSGIRVVVQGSATSGVISVTNNTIREVPNADIITAIGQNGAGSSPSANARFKILNNNMPQPSGSNFDFCGIPNTACASNGIFVLADEGSPVCNVITGNTIYDLSLMNGIADVYLAERTGPPAGAQLTVEGTGGSNSAYILANNTLAGPSQFIDEGGNTSQVPPGACGTFPAMALTLQESGMTKSNSLALQMAEGSATRTEDILMAAGIEKPVEEKVTSLNQGALNWMVQAALARWENAGIPAEDLMRLRQTTFEVADLPGQQLATASSTSVKIDETAAGYGWYSDLSPMEDSEFDVFVLDRELQSTEYKPAFGRMDLLTVVMRELGSVYLQGNERIPKQLRPLMETTLSPAVRRLPDSRSIQLGRAPVRLSGTKQPDQEKSFAARAGKPSALPSKTGVSISPVSVKNAGFNAIAKTTSEQSRQMNHALRNRTTAASLSSTLADVMLSIGTLPAGESVIITFNASVDDPFTGALPQVSNQGTVSGSNFSDVLTDDPSVGGTADPTVTPIDLPQVTLAVSPASVLEDGATNLVYTFTRTGSTASAMTVNFSVGGTASFTQPDYSQSGAATFSATSGTVVIPAGSSTATVTIDPSADTTVEPDETVNLTVTSGAGYTVGSPSAASGIITNDDTDVSVAVSPASVAEDGATNLVYTFTRVGVTTNALTVNFSIAVGGNNATFPVDYTQSGASTFAPPVGTVAFAPGNSTATVTVDPTADPIVEPDETVIFTVTSGTGYNVGSPSVATGTITNDDADVSVTVAPSSVTEDGPTNLVYTFTRTGFTLLPVTVNFSVGGTAVFSQPDYTQTGAATYSDTSGTVVFGVGQATATVTIDPTADSTPEPDETVTLTVTSGTGYNVGSPSSATGTILNDDTANNVTALGPANFWVGLKNSDDVGLRFDFLVEVYRNGQLIGSGQLNNQAGGSSGFNNAILRTVAIIQSQPASFLPGDQLSVKISVRAGPTGHVGGYARLWYNDAAANSRFDLELDGNPNTYYLLDGFLLGSAAGPGPKKTIDVLVNRNQNGNAFQPFGTWVKTF